MKDENSNTKTRACPANAMQHEVLLLAASHRKGGNSDKAAELMRQSIEDAGHAAEILHVRDFPVLPCLGCGHCAKSDGHACVLAGKDRAEELFAKIVAADLIFIASPIYFYHLPSMFKAVIDRSQRFWEASLKGNPLAIRPKNCGVALVAARPRGENLFAGSLLTLKYFLDQLNARIKANENFYGLDRPGDFDQDGANKSRLKEMVRTVLRAGQG